jgi:hypothetical protein
MPHQTCGEALWNPCALTLGDELLAGGVEHGPMQLWVSPSQVSIPLHNPVHCEVQEQPASLRQSSIQQLFKQPKKGYLPLCCLSLHQANHIRSDADEASQVDLSCDLLRHQSTERMPVSKPTRVQNAALYPLH